MSITDRFHNASDIIKTIETNNAPAFNIKGSFIGRVINCYDGDTCHVVMNYMNTVCTFRIRLLGYDAEEIKQPKQAENRVVLKQIALEQKNKLIDLTVGKTVLVESIGFDAFGRLLSHIYIIIDGKIQEHSISHQMIEAFPSISS